MCEKIVKRHGRKFCSSLCSGKVRQLGETKNCCVCGKTFYAKLKDIKRGWGKFCSRGCWYKNPRSEEYRENLAKWQRGENSQHWLGGTSYSLQKTYGSYKWQLIRERIFERDKYTCRKCLKVCNRGKLDCHHLIPYRVGIKRRFLFWNVEVNDISNLVSLCKSCHKYVDNGYHKLEKEGKYGLQAIYHLVA